MLERKFLDEQENTSEKNAWSVLFQSGICASIITQCHSVAKSVEYFQQHLFVSVFVCLFVCQHGNF